MRVKNFFLKTKSYELVFVIAVLLSFAVWLGGIFIEGGDKTDHSFPSFSTD